MSQERNELDYIKKYQNQGFTCNFRFENEKLVESNTKNGYKPEQIIIKREHRFEGISNPSDMSILYVIETTDGHKGLVTANYSYNSDTGLDEFFKNIPKENDLSKRNI